MARQRRAGRAQRATRVRCTRVLGGLSIDVLAVRDSNDEHHQLVIGNGVNDSILTDPDAVSIGLSRELFAPCRPRFLRQREYLRHDALPISLLVNGLDLLGRRRLDQYPITCHAA